MSTSRVLGQRRDPLVAVRVAAVLVLTLVDLAPVVSIPLLSGVNNLGDGHDNISVGAGGSRSDDRGLESGAGSGSGLSCDGRRCRGGSAVVGLVARADGDSDDGVSGASLHAVGIIGSVAVGLLLRRARGALGGDLPVSVPGVAVDLAQVIPDGSVVLVGVLVLEDVLKGRAVGKLDGPAVAVGERSPGLGVGVRGTKDLVDLRVSTVGRRDVDKSDIVVALVDDDGLTNRVGSSSSNQGSSSVNGVLHFDDWSVFLKVSRTVGLKFECW
jgi:hypothetical protein